MAGCSGFLKAEVQQELIEEGERLWITTDPFVSIALESRRNAQSFDLIGRRAMKILNRSTPPGEPKPNIVRPKMPKMKTNM